MNAVVQSRPRRGQRKDICRLTQVDTATTGAMHELEPSIVSAGVAVFRSAVSRLSREKQRGKRF